MSGFLLYDKIGPVLRAESVLNVPVIGGTNQFLIKITRDNAPVSNASVTVKVTNALGAIVYPISGSGTQAVPLDNRYPGTYTIVPASTSIFTSSEEYYTVHWMISVAADAYYPQCVLPLTQKLLPVEP